MCMCVYLISHNHVGNAGPLDPERSEKDVAWSIGVLRPLCRQVPRRERDLFRRLDFAFVLLRFASRSLVYAA